MYLVCFSCCFPPLHSQQEVYNSQKTITGNTHQKQKHITSKPRNFHQHFVRSARRSRIRSAMKCKRPVDCLRKFCAEGAASRLRRSNEAPASWVFLFPPPGVWCLWDLWGCGFWSLLGCLGMYIPFAGGRGFAELLHLVVVFFCGLQVANPTKTIEYSLAD